LFVDSYLAHRGGHRAERARAVRKLDPDQKGHRPPCLFTRRANSIHILHYDAPIPIARALAGRRLSQSETAGRVPQHATGYPGCEKIRG
jgi:hypothetical protein